MKLHFGCQATFTVSTHLRSTPAWQVENHWSNKNKDALAALRTPLPCELWTNKPPFPPPFPPHPMRARTPALTLPQADGNTAIAVQVRNEYDTLRHLQPIGGDV